MAGSAADRLSLMASLARRVQGVCLLTREAGGASPKLLARVAADEFFASALEIAACSALKLPEPLQSKVLPELERNALEWHAKGGCDWVKTPAADALPN